MIERQAVRALLISPQEELLLIKVIEPESKRPSDYPLAALTPASPLPPV